MSFGYEEAIGFCPDPQAVRDKDGVATSVVLASLASECKDAGITLQDRLAEIYSTVGRLATAPLTFRVEDLSLITRGMERSPRPHRLNWRARRLQRQRSLPKA